MKNIIATFTQSRRERWAGVGEVHPRPEVFNYNTCIQPIWANKRRNGCYFFIVSIDEKERKAFFSHFYSHSMRLECARDSCWRGRAVVTGFSSTVSSNNALIYRRSVKSRPPNNSKYIHCHYFSFYRNGAKYFQRRGAKATTTHSTKYFFFLFADLGSRRSRKNYSVIWRCLLWYRLLSIFRYVNAFVWKCMWNILNMSSFSAQLTIHSLQLKREVPTSESPKILGILKLRV